MTFLQNHPVTQFKSYNFHNMYISTIFVTNEITCFQDIGVELHDDSLRPMSMEILKFSVFRDRVSINSIKNSENESNNSVLSKAKGHLLIGINTTMLKYRGIDYANSVLRKEVRKWPVINLITLSLDLQPQDLPGWEIPVLKTSGNGAVT